MSLQGVEAAVVYNNKLYYEVGKLVREKREQANLTQDELARRIGLTRTAVTSIESGRQRILVHTLVAIANALDLVPSDLLPISSAHAHKTDGDSLLQQLSPATARFAERILAAETK